MQRLARRAEPALVAALVVIGLVQHPWGRGVSPFAGVAWVMLLCLPLTVRLRYPATACVVLCVGLLAYTVVTGARTPFVAAVVAFLIAFYSVGAWAQSGPAAAALAVGLAAFWAQDLRLHHAAGEYVASAILVAGPWAAGRALRRSRATSRRLLDVTEALAAEREARARDAVLAERATIARDMHDAVGHSLSVISLQVQAAAAALEHDPRLVPQPLAAIEEATRLALGEMRRLVRVLDDGSEPDEALRPPRLEDLVALVAQHRASGLDVDLELGDVPAAVPGYVEGEAFRIVQEGLTNVRRHTSARRAAVRVQVTGSPPSLQVEVVDEGPRARPSAPVLGGGHGLAGARARAQACGGFLHSGPQGAGWSLRAVLPFDGVPGAPRGPGPGPGPRSVSAS